LRNTTIRRSRCECGVEFTPRGRQKYCSDACRKLAWERKHSQERNAAAVTKRAARETSQNPEQQPAPYVAGTPWRFSPTPAPELSLDERRDIRANKFLESFGHLSHAGKERIWQLLRLLPPIYDNLIRRIGSVHKTGIDPISRTVEKKGIAAHPPEEDEEAIQPLFPEGRAAFTSKFGREFARSRISDRRLSKAAEEEELCSVLAQMLLEHSKQA